MNPDEDCTVRPGIGPMVDDVVRLSIDKLHDVFQAYRGSSGGVPSIFPRSLVHFHDEDENNALQYGNASPFRYSLICLAGIKRY